MSAKKQNYQSVVQKVIPRGRHGPYAVASCESVGAITFSLDEPVWSEAVYPEPGTYVMLSGLYKKRAGWRASQARFFQPADELADQ